MTKILIVDYSLEIVIVIINNDYFEQIYARAGPNTIFWASV